MNNEKETSLTKANKQPDYQLRRIAVAAGLIAAGGLGTLGIVSEVHHQEIVNDGQPSNEVISVYPGDTLSTIADDLAPADQEAHTLKLLEVANPETAKPDYVPQPGEHLSIPIALVDEDSSK